MTLIAFPGVLRRVGGGQHHPTVPRALKDRGRAHARADRALAAARERAAVTAVKHEHLPFRSAAIHFAGDEVRGNGRAAQQIAFGVFDGQIEVTLIVEDAMAGEVQQHEIVGGLLREQASQSNGAAARPIR